MTAQALRSASALSIRPSADEDTPAITRIYAHHVEHGFGSFEEAAPTVAEMERRRADILSRGMPYLVADQAGTVVGYAYVSLYRPRPAYRFTVENSVYVAHDAIRQGVGQSLLAGLIDRCTELGFRQMVAVIGDADNAGSIGLHAALGFHRAGELTAVGFKRGRWVDCVLMQRPLGDANASPPSIPPMPRR